MRKSSPKTPERQPPPAKGQLRTESLLRQGRSPSSASASIVVQTGNALLNKIGDAGVNPVGGASWGTHRVPHTRGALLYVYEAGIRRIDVEKPMSREETQEAVISGCIELHPLNCVRGARPLPQF
jgi:hypothetical protein